MAVSFVEIALADLQVQTTYKLQRLLQIHTICEADGVFCTLHIVFSGPQAMSTFLWARLKESKRGTAGPDNG